MRCKQEFSFLREGVMDRRAIIDLNIKYYRGLLQTEVDTSKRRMIAQLLADEEARLGKLAAITLAET